MIRYIEAIEHLPVEIKLPLIKAFELFKEEIAETVKRSDFERFERATEENFKRVWKSIEELAEAQKRTEQKVEELAEAQKRTEKELQSLIKDHKELRKEVGGLSHTVGYRLEDESYKALPGLLRQDIGIEVIGRLKRDFIEIGKDRYIEVNIWGKGRSDGKEYVIIGEAKTQLKKRDIDDFIKRANELKRYVPEDQVRVLVTYHTSPQVMKYAREKNVKVYFSYDF